jgi:uncharacterized protein (TIGR00251 family)
VVPPRQPGSAAPEHRSAAAALLQRPGGVLWLDVAVTPGARRNAADGWHDGALRVRLTAPPVDGQANAALVSWLAAQLHLPQRAVRIVRGVSARRKRVELDAPWESTLRWLSAVAGPEDG